MTIIAQCVSDLNVGAAISRPDAAGQDATSPERQPLAQTGLRSIWLTSAAGRPS